MGRTSRSALIVSDSAALRRYMASTLETAGFAPTEASSGFQAMDCLSERLFDVYLIDLDIAASDGLSIFAITLTGGFRDPSPVLVGISDKPGEEVIRPPWGDATSFAALFAKPFRPDDLIVAVETALARPVPAIVADPSDF